MKKTQKLKTKHRRAAKVVGEGGTYEEAYRAAGGKGKRGVQTVCEWMRLESFRRYAEKHADKVMNAQEWDRLTGDQARMLKPTRIETDGAGRVTKQIFDSDKAMERQGKRLGLLKDGIELSGPHGTPILTESKVTLYMPDNGKAKP